MGNFGFSRVYFRNIIVVTICYLVIPGIGDQTLASRYKVFVSGPNRSNLKMFYWSISLLVENPCNRIQFYFERIGKMEPIIMFIHSIGMKFNNHFIIHC